MLLVTLHYSMKVFDNLQMMLEAKE